MAASKASVLNKPEKHEISINNRASDSIEQESGLRKTPKNECSRAMSNGATQSIGEHERAKLPK
jgi:hypothetical protein